MVRVVNQDPSWGKGLQALSDVLFPDPRNKMQAIYQAAQARSALDRAAVDRAEAARIRAQQDRLPAASGALADVLASSGVEFTRDMPQNQFSVPAGRPPATAPVDLRPLAAYTLGGGGNAQTLAQSLAPFMGALGTQTGKEPQMRAAAQQFGINLGPDYAGTTARADQVAGRNAEAERALQQLTENAATGRTRIEQTGETTRHTAQLENDLKINEAKLTNARRLKDIETTNALSIERMKLQNALRIARLEDQGKTRRTVKELRNDLTMKREELSNALEMGDRELANQLTIERDTLANALSIAELEQQGEMDRLVYETEQGPQILGPGETLRRPGQPAYTAPYEPMAVEPDETIYNPNTGARIAGPEPGAAGSSAGPYAGTGQSQQDMNIILAFNNAVRENRPITTDDIVRYTQAYTRQYAPREEVRQTDRGAVKIQINPPTPQGIINPQVFFPGQATPQAPVPGAAGAGAADIEMPSRAAPVPGAAQIIPGTERAPKPRTEQQAKMYQYGQRVAKGAQDLFALFGYDPETGGLDPAGYRPDIQTGIASVMPEMFRGYLVGEADEAYMTGRATALNPLIRADSGAAVPIGEYPQYAQQFIPSPGEEEATIQTKFDNLLITLMAFQELGQRVGRDPSTLSDEELQDVHGDYVAIKSRIAEDLAAQRAGRAAPGAGSPPAAEAQGQTEGRTSSGVQWRRAE